MNMSNIRNIGFVQVVVHTYIKHILYFGLRLGIDSGTNVHIKSLSQEQIVGQYKLHSSTVSVFHYHFDGRIRSV